MVIHVIEDQNERDKGLLSMDVRIFCGRNINIFDYGILPQTCVIYGVYTMLCFYNLIFFFLCSEAHLASGVLDKDHLPIILTVKFKSKKYLRKMSKIF